MDTLFGYLEPKFQNDPFVTESIFRDACLLCTCLVAYDAHRMYNFQLIENLSLIVDKMGSEIEKFSSSKNELILPKNPIIHLTFFEHSLKPNFFYFYLVFTVEWSLAVVIVQKSGRSLEILLGSLENLAARQNSNSKLLEKILLEKGSNSILLEKDFARTRSLEICHARFCSFLLDNWSTINNVNTLYSLALVFIPLFIQNF